MATPTRTNLYAVADRIINGYANVCLVGTSLSAHGSGWRPQGGISRTWDVPIVGFLFPHTIQNQSEGGNIYNAPPQLSSPDSGPWAVSAGSTYKFEGVTCDWPLGGTECKYIKDYTWGQVMYLASLANTFQDGMLHGRLAEMSGTLRLRMMYRRTGSESTNLTINARRGDGNNTQSTVNLTTNGQAGSTYIDQDFGTTDGDHGATVTDWYVAGTNAVDETDTIITFLGFRVWLPDATTGLSLSSSIAAGGWSTNNHLVDGGEERYTDAELQKYMEYAGNPNIFIIELGQNDGDNNKAAFKANVETIIARYKTVAAAAGTSDLLFMLMPTWDTSVPNTRHLEYSEAMTEIALADSSVSCCNLRQIVENKYGEFDTEDPENWSQTLLGDNVHQSEAGTDEFMQLVWDELVLSEANDGIIPRRAQRGYPTYLRSPSGVR